MYYTIIASSPRMYVIVSLRLNIYEMSLLFAKCFTRILNYQREIIIYAPLNIRYREVMAR